jgi:hypothetical protein
MFVDVTDAVVAAPHFCPKHCPPLMFPVGPDVVGRFNCALMTHVRPFLLFDVGRSLMLLFVAHLRRFILLQRPCFRRVH